MSGQVTEAVSPLAQGSTLARYRTIYTYDRSFGLPLTRTFMTNANTTIQERNVLSSDSRNIARTYVYENNVRQSRTDFFHDTHGNVTEIREFPDSRGAAFITTQIVYDRDTLPQTIRTTGVRDANGTLLNVNGIVERRFTYDTMWRMLSETDFDINDNAGNARVVTTIHGDANAPSIQTFVQYDRFGRRTQEGTMGGRIFTYTHDIIGRVLTEQSLGINNTYTHNIFGITAVRNIEGNTAHSTYDSMGRLIRTSDFIIFNGGVTEFTYDALGRLIQRNEAFYLRQYRDTTTVFASTRYFYDRNGNLTQVITPTGIPAQTQTWSTTENTFRHNRLTTTQIGGTSGIRTDYTCDLAGNILTKRVGTATTTFTYNNRGQLIRTTDALGQVETFTYDANGNLLTKTDRNGILLFQMVYDHMGRLIRHELIHNNRVTIHQTYTFTATGALRTSSNGFHTITKSYDAQGRLIRQEETSLNRTGSVLKTFQYNAANNRTQSRIYVNNALFQNNTYTYNTAQRLHTVRSNNELLATYTYDVNGRVRTVTMGNGVVTTYTRNLAGIVTSVTNLRGSTLLSSTSYTHYLDGNTRQRTENLNGVTRTITYTYDQTRRLTREQSTGGGVGAYTRAYTFDARGNRTQMTVTGAETYTVTYTYDLNNRLLTEVRTGSSPSTTTYTYDRNGNQLTKTAGGITHRTYYNAFNQLIAATQPGRTTTYRYRADGLRHEKTITTVNNVTTTHVWNGAQIVLERNNAGAVINRFDRTPSGRLIRSQHHGWYHHNARGDVIQRTNNSGAVLHNYRYSAFGIELGAIDTSPFISAGDYQYMGGAFITITENNLPNVISYVPTWIDPQFVIRMRSVRNEELKVTLTITSNERSNGQIFFRIIGTPFNQPQSIWFNIYPGTREYVVNMGRISADELRIDIGVEGSPITLRNLRLYVANPIVNPTNTNPFRFAGEYYDWETGTYYLRARSFNPRTGRFTQPDPHWTIHNGNMIFGDSPTLRNDRYMPSVHAILQASNLFVYTMNNPINWLDPSGLHVIELGRGWYARVERGVYPNTQRHVHVYHQRHGAWSQNEDGSPHDDGNNSSGSPPQRALRDLKSKTGWDWQKKQTEWIREITVHYQVFNDMGESYSEIIFPSGKTVRSYPLPMPCPFTRIGTISNDTLIRIYLESDTGTIGSHSNLSPINPNPMMPLPAPMPRVMPFPARIPLAPIRI